MASHGTARSIHRALRHLVRAGGLATMAALIVSGIFGAGIVALTRGSGSTAAINATETPAVTAVSSPTPCGVPVTSWGIAIASDVRIHILDVQTSVPFDSTPTPSPTMQHTVVLLEVTNQGDRPVRIDTTDVKMFTCLGQEFNPVKGDDQRTLRLGEYGPGDSREGILTFEIPLDDQAQRLSIGIQEEERSGARVDCDVVARNNITAGANTAIGCSARGGDAKAGADAVGTDATASAGDD